MPASGMQRLTTGRSEKRKETVDNSENKWEKLEEIVRRVIKEEIACLGKKQKVALHGGKWVGLTTEQMAAWSAAYPSLDLAAELNRAAAWITSNPHLAPKSQYARFINHWLSKSHNTLSIRSIPTRSDRQEKPTCAYCDRPATGSPNRTQACDLHFEDAMGHKPAVKRA